MPYHFTWAASQLYKSNMKASAIEIAIVDKCNFASLLFTPVKCVPVDYYVARNGLLFKQNDYQ